MKMDCFKWIYFNSFLVCIIAFSVSNRSANNLKNEKRHRKNSKMMQDFPGPERHLKGFRNIDDILRSWVNETTPKEASDELEPKIINGRKAEPGEYPWMVALYFSGRFICSAFLVSPTIVLTAAHCVEYEDDVEPAENFYGVIGTTNRESVEKKINFTEIKTHPDFGHRNSEADIAILRTSEPIEYTEWIKPICLPSGGRDFELEYVQAMGWGITSNEADGAPDELMTTELVSQPLSVCRFFFAFMFLTITDRHICASANTATGACFGDSGGPLVREDIYTGRPMAVGIASFVTFLGCGRPMVPGAYTATAPFADWIKKEVGSRSGICFV